MVASLQFVSILIHISEKVPALNLFKGDFRKGIDRPESGIVG